jgi:hypothetical protein
MFSNIPCQHFMIKMIMHSFKMRYLLVRQTNRQSLETILQTKPCQTGNRCCFYACHSNILAARYVTVRLLEQPPLLTGTRTPELVSKVITFWKTTNQYYLPTWSDSKTELCDLPMRETNTCRSGKNQSRFFWISSKGKQLLYCLRDETWRESGHMA